MSAVRLRDGKGPPRESRRGSGSGRRLPSLEAPSETTRRARECVPRSARNGVRPPRGFRNLLPGKTDAAHVANSSLVSFRTKDTLAVPTSVWPTGRACYHFRARLATCPSPSPEPPSPPAARARPPRLRAFRARSTRAPSGVFPRDPFARSHTAALRAAEDDETPAPAPAPEELAFPELSDDEEVKGAQITAIITGASRTRTDRRDGRLGRYPSGRRGAYARNRETRAREREKRARSSVNDDAMLTPSSSRFRQVS